MSIQKPFSAVPIGEVSEVNPKGPGKAELKPDAELDFLPMADLHEDGSVHVAVRRRYEEVAKGYTAFKEGDVLIAKITPCFENNKIGVAKVKTEWAFGSTEYHVLRPSGRVDASYLTHFLRQDSVRNEGEKRMTGSGGQRRVPKAFIEDLQIPLPPLEEQRRIAAILDQADALRRLCRRALDKLNTLGQAIFHEMFGDGLPSNTSVRLGDVASKIGSGATPRGGDSAYKSEGIPLIRSMNVRDGAFSNKGLAFIDDEQASKLDNVIVEANDVLLNITGASVARVCIAPGDMNGARVNQHVAIIRCDDSLLPEFLEAFLLLPSIKAKLLNIAEAGATRQAITKAQIQDFQVPKFDPSEQKAFVERRKLISNQRARMHTQEIAYEALFASLQHRAFKGEL